MDLFDISGKVVLITGSSRGLGAVYAEGFAQAGATVVVNGRNAETVDKCVDSIRQSGGKAEAAVFDISDSTAAENAVKAIESAHGKVDVLINNAGIHRRGPLEELSDDDWQTVIDTNLTAAFVVARCVVKGMIKRGEGKIINITSLMAEGARPTTGNYAAAKGGLKMLTRAMATEWGRYNIQVNSIGPGYFLTDLTRPLTEDEEFDAWVRKEVPLGRWGDPRELLGAAIFLASDASSYVNGQTIYVDGGWLASL